MTDPRMKQFLTAAFDPSHSPLSVLIAEKGEREGKKRTIWGYLSSSKTEMLSSLMFKNLWGQQSGTSVSLSRGVEGRGSLMRNKRRLTDQPIRAFLVLCNHSWALLLKVHHLVRSWEERTSTWLRWTLQVDQMGLRRRGELWRACMRYWDALVDYRGVLGVALSDLREV